MLLQSAPRQTLDDEQVSVGAEVAAFKASPRSMMAHNFQVPEDRVALDKVELELAAQRRAWSILYLLIDDLAGFASALHSVQLPTKTADKAGVQCVQRRRLRGPLSDSEFGAGHDADRLPTRPAFGVRLTPCTARPGVNLVAPDSRNSLLVSDAPKADDRSDTAGSVGDELHHADRRCRRGADAGRFWSMLARAATQGGGRERHCQGGAVDGHGGAQGSVGRGDARGGLGV